MIPGHLKMGEHQAKCEALLSLSHNLTRTHKKAALSIIKVVKIGLNCIIVNINIINLINLMINIILIVIILIT